MYLSPRKSYFQFIITILTSGIQFKVYNNTNHFYIIPVSVSRILDYVFLYLVNPSCTLLKQCLCHKDNSELPLGFYQWLLKLVPLASFITTLASLTLSLSNDLNKGNPNIACNPKNIPTIAIPA